MSLATTFTTRPGGIMTVEVGTITGEVEMETSTQEGRTRHRVRYAGADEWYRLEGEPTAVDEGEERLRRAHEELVGSLRASAGGESPRSDPPHGSQVGSDADDPAAGSFGSARHG